MAPLPISSNQVRGYTVLVLAAIIWGTEAIAAKLCFNGGFTVIALLAWRYMASVPVFSLVVKRQRESLLPPKGTIKALLLLSVNVVAGVIALYIALDLLPPTLAILFFYAYPSFTSLLHILLRRSALGTPRLLALVLSAVGLIMLYWSTVDNLSLLGVAAALLSAALQAGKLFQTAALLPRVSAARLNLFNAVFTAVCATLIYLVMGSFGGGLGLSAISGQAWLSMLFLGVFVTVFGNLLMTLGIHYVGAVDSSLVLLLEPPTTAVLAYFVFGDTLSLGQLMGGLLILLAVALPTVAGLRKASLSKKGVADNDGN